MEQRIAFTVAQSLSSLACFKKVSVGRSVSRGDNIYEPQFDVCPLNMHNIIMFFCIAMHIDDVHPRDIA